MKTTPLQSFSQILWLWYFQNVSHVEGQIELYTHLPVMRQLVEQLQQWEFRVCGVFLVDSQFMVETFKVTACYARDIILPASYCWEITPFKMIKHLNRPVGSYFSTATAGADIILLITRLLNKWINKWTQKEQPNKIIPCSRLWKYSIIIVLSVVSASPLSHFKCFQNVKL